MPTILFTQPLEQLLGYNSHLKNSSKKEYKFLLKPIPLLPKTPKIRVKVTGDGTRICHSMHAVVIAFVVVEDGANPNSPGGNHTIAIFNAGEKYDVLSEALVDI